MQRPENGDVGQLERGRCVMPADCVSLLTQPCNRTFHQGHVEGTDGTMIDYAKLTRKMGSKAAVSTGGNLRPKEMGALGSPVQQ